MKIQPLFRRRGVKIVIGIALALVLFLALLPLAGKYYLIHWLKSNGAENATIETLTFNPFLGRLTLGGLDVQGGERSILHHSQLVIDLGLTSLFDRDIRVKRAEYRDLFIEIEQLGDGNWRYGSYTTSGERRAQQLDPPNPSGPGWGFRADHVLVDNCAVHLRTPALDLTLTIDQAELNRFTTREGDRAGSLQLRGKIDDSPVTLAIDSIKIQPSLEIDGNIEISAFNLAELGDLLAPVLPKLSGMFELKGKLAFAMSESEGIRAGYQGTLDLASADIGGDDFTTVLESLRWDGRLHYDAPTDQPAEFASDGLLAARGAGLQVPAAQLAFSSGEINLEGKTQLALADKLTIASDGALSLQTVKAQLPDLSLKEKAFSWKGKIEYAAADPNSKVHSAGTLRLEGIDLTKTDQDNPLEFTGKSLGWDGGIELVLGAGAGGKLKADLDGTLTGTSLVASLSEPPLLLEQGQLTLQSRTALTVGESLTLSAKSSLDLGPGKIQQGKGAEALTVGFDRLTINGAENTETTVSAAELLGVNLSALIPGNLPLAVKVPELLLSDFSSSDLATFTISDLLVQQFQAASSLSNDELAALGQLSMNNITAGKEGNFAAEQLELSHLTLLRSTTEPQTQPIFTLAGLSTDRLSWDPQEGFASDVLALDQLAVDVQRNKDGEMNLAGMLAAMRQPGPAEVQAAEAAEETAAASPPENETTAGDSPPPIRITAVTISKDSVLSFLDQTLAVPYATSLNIQEFSLKDLDSSRPEDPSTLLLEGTLEKKAPIRISGKLTPFTDKPGVDLDLVLKNYPLTSLSPYTVQSVGTALAGGNLKLQTKMTLADEAIDMKNDIVLAGLKTDTISPKLAAELNNQLPVPLDAALVMMRDDNGNIRLNIPINGPLDHLDVGIAPIIITALNKSIASAATSYFTYALGPYAALAYVGMKVGQKMLQVKLPPVTFAAQATELTAEHKDYLGRIAKIMKEQKKADLRLTAHVIAKELEQPGEAAEQQEATAATEPERQQQLQQLAEQRLAAITAYLTGEQGIDKLRVLHSDTVVESKADAKSRVELEVK